MAPSAQKKAVPWPPEENFWDRLQRVRRGRGVDNKKIAAVAGVAVGTVSNWKRGQRPDTPALLALARFFDVPPEWLLTGKLPSAKDRAAGG